MTGPEEVDDVDADRDDQQHDGGGLDSEKAGPQVVPDKPGDAPPPNLDDDPNALPNTPHDPGAGDERG